MHTSVVHVKDPRSVGRPISEKRIPRPQDVVHAPKLKDAPRIYVGGRGSRRSSKRFARGARPHVEDVPS